MLKYGNFRYKALSLKVYFSDVNTIDEKENKQSSLVNIPNETKDNYSICYNMKNFLFNPDNDIHLYFHILGIYAFKLYKEPKNNKIINLYLKHLP